MMKRFLLGVSVLCLVFALAGPAPAAEPIRIGVAGAHSGDLASYGLPTVKAVELVVKDVNARGGVLGRKIELLVEDDVCKPEVATNTASKLVGDKVIAVIGHICSGATKAALGIYKDAKIITISPSATNPPLTKSGDYPNFFRTIASDDAQAEVDVEFAMKKLGFKKFAVLHDQLGGLDRRQSVGGEVAGVGARDADLDRLRSLVGAADEGQEGDRRESG